jgi:hypothetical protein
MGHRRFLPKDHPYRRNRKDFDGTIEKRLPPKYQDWPMILREVNKLDVVLGKGDNIVAAPDRSVRKKNLVFSKLPYQLVLSVRHCLDPVHIIKNMCGNTLNTLMDTGGTSKDSLATHLGIRKDCIPWR